MLYGETKNPEITPGTGVKREAGWGGGKKTGAEWRNVFLPDPSGKGKQRPWGGVG